MARYLISATLSQSALREQLRAAGYAVASVQALSPSAATSHFEIEVPGRPASLAEVAREMSKLSGVSKVLPIPDAE